jgi:DNA-directed RNA polymerase subunit RPC12/RpoP
VSETVRHMILRGTAAARAGDMDEARRYLERALHNGATREQAEHAHMWLSKITAEPARQREHLEHVLASNPTHGEARRALAVLDGRLDPADVVNPDQLSQPAPAGEEPAGPRQITARRFICPQCAGRVRFEPGQARVECLYCGHRLPLLTVLQEQAPMQESDFIVTLATAKGHALPAGMQACRCEGCQATLLVAGTLSTHCPYCGSSQIIETLSTSMIPPEGVIPFGIDAATAQAAFRTWLETRFRGRRVRTTRVRGVYLPVWTFQLLGELAWRGVEAEQKRGLGGFTFGESGIHAKSRRVPGMQRRAHEGSHYVMIDDVPVPASHKVPYALRAIHAGFDWSQAVAYDPSYLSDWPAELYEITVSDASLVARRQVLEQARSKVQLQAEAQVGNLQDLQIFPRNLAVDSYKLMLAPAWIANYRYEEVTYTVVVNGQTGAVAGQEPPGALKKLVSSLLGG